MKKSEDTQRVVELGGRPLRLRISTFGLTVVSLTHAQKGQPSESLVLAYENLEDFLKNYASLGSTIGPVAGRLVKANGEVELHSGPGGFSRRYWTVEKFDNNAATFTLPYEKATIKVVVAVEDTTVKWTFEAVGIHPSFINMTQHSYFCLGPGGARAHALKVEDDTFVPLSKDLLPAGKPIKLAGEAGLLAKGVRLHSILDSLPEPFKQTKGIDHFFPIKGSSLRKMATLTHGKRSLELWSSQQGVQIYTANFLNELKTKSQDHPLGEYGGVCLESQAVPNAPHLAWAPSIELNPNETYRETFEWRFRV